jgi:ABC-type nitrate/sulfonate/bicarbonate transport system substrate-binding protein
MEPTSMVDWMPSALASREAGVPLVNMAQVFNQSGLMLTCKKASGVASPKDLKGKTLGVWYGGNEYPFLNWMGKLGLTETPTSRSSSRASTSTRCCKTRPPVSPP